MNGIVIASIWFIEVYLCTLRPFDVTLKLDSFVVGILWCAIDMVGQNQNQPKTSPKHFRASELLHYLFAGTTQLNMMICPLSLNVWGWSY